MPVVACNSVGATTTLTVSHVTARQPTTSQSLYFFLKILREPALALERWSCVDSGAIHQKY